jgi:hypothetical protein
MRAVILREQFVGQALRLLATDALALQSAAMRLADTTAKAIARATRRC